jgi:hypothetical protein
MIEISGFRLGVLFYDDETEKLLFPTGQIHNNMWLSCVALEF